MDADTAILFHSLRKVRNQAGHEGYESVSDARNYLGITYSMSEWFMQTYGDYQYKNRPFVMPKETVEPAKDDKIDEEALEKILLQQATENAAKAPKVNKADRQKYARKAAGQRYKSEAETRVLIDEQLRQVGWEADTENLRSYQIAAIQAAEKAVLADQQNIPLAMATGTGKTRTVLGLIYRFLKTNRFRRILFLVDRNSLGTQAHDVFKDVKLEELMSLNQIYNIKGLDEKLIDRETRVQVATIQGMIQRIVFNDDDRKPAVSDYDLIIVDEAHRGYTLDKMMDEEEIAYRDQRDYQNKYRAVIEYFTAVKIALTATPALHTTQIFGEPVFKYTYREAVIDGFLVDYDAPHISLSRCWGGLRVFALLFIKTILRSMTLWALSPVWSRSAP